MRKEFQLLVWFLSSIRLAELQRSNLSEWINFLLDEKKYDNRIRPHYHSHPVDVTVAFYVLATDDVDLSNMDYTVEFYLKQEWFDDRLTHNYETEIVLDDEMQKRLWLPDSYVVNAKYSSFHKVTMINRLAKIHRNGKVHFNVRLSVRASCPVDLRMFPWDIQSCPLILESCISQGSMYPTVKASQKQNEFTTFQRKPNFASIKKQNTCPTGFLISHLPSLHEQQYPLKKNGYSTKHIRYYWAGNAKNGNEFASNVKEMAQYMLQGVVLDQRVNEYAIGNWSTLTAFFHFKRLNGFYLLQTIGPSVIIVIISWISFIIEPDQHPARTSLGITSILTMAAIQQFINNSLPKVSYIKIIDIYSIACYLFVYMALIEYAIVLLILERIKKEMKLLQKGTDTPQPILRRIQRQAARGEDILDRLNRLWWHFRLRIKQPIFCFKNRTEKTARRIDEVCRVLFPFCFIVFNALFWIYVNLPVTRELRSDEPP